MSLLTRWQPFHQLWREMDAFRNELNQVFDRWDSGRGNQQDWRAGYPPVNLWEDENDLYAEIELPGLTLDNIEVYVTGSDQLIIKGDRQTPKVDKAVWHRQERGYGTFERMITLPDHVDADRVEARFDHGVLMVRMAKKEEAKPKKITVKAE